MYSKFVHFTSHAKQYFIFWNLVIFYDMIKNCSILKLPYSNCKNCITTCCQRATWKNTSYLNFSKFDDISFIQFNKSRKIVRHRIKITKEEIYLCSRNSLITKLKWTRKLYFVILADFIAAFLTTWCDTSGFRTTWWDTTCILTTRCDLHWNFKKFDLPGSSI